MQIKPGLRHAALSMLVFAGVLLAIVSIDARVRERVSDAVYGADGVSSWGDRLTDVLGAMASAVRYQSIDNGAMMIFTVVSAVLFVFMFKS